jgi:hypothetical protein
MEDIREGMPVFLHDGDVAVGAVRKRSPLIIHIENAGEFAVPQAAVQDVHFDKLLLDASKLDARLNAAIGRAHLVEDKDNSVTRRPID